MDIDYNTQTGFILIFFILLGYIVGGYFNIGYLGNAYKPKGGDFERFLGLFSKGMTTFLLILGAFIFLFFKLIPTLATSYLPQIDINLVPLSIVLSIVLSYLFLIAVALSLLFGVIIRSLKNKSNKIKITIETSDNTGSIAAREIYDENAEYFFYFDENKNWGLIKKSFVKKITSNKLEHVNRITSNRMEHVMTDNDKNWEMPLAFIFLYLTLYTIIKDGFANKMSTIESWLIPLGAGVATVVVTYLVRRFYVKK